MVSRQGLALLSAIGLAELAAEDAQAYVSLAVALATDPDRLRALRGGLRERMRCAPLMDVVGFTHQLEETFIELFERVALSAET